MGALVVRAAGWGLCLGPLLGASAYGFTCGPTRHMRRRCAPASPGGGPALVGGEGRCMSAQARRRWRTGSDSAEPRSRRVEIARLRAPRSITFANEDIHASDAHEHDCTGHGPR